MQNEAELIRSLGMSNAALDRWRNDNARTRWRNRSPPPTAWVASRHLTKTLRLFLQSAMLGLGAYLVLQNQLTAGAMIAGSILLGPGAWRRLNWPSANGP